MSDRAWLVWVENGGAGPQILAISALVPAGEGKGPQSRAQRVAIYPNPSPPARRWGRLGILVTLYYFCSCRTFHHPPAVQIENMAPSPPQPQSLLGWFKGEWQATASPDQPPPATSARPYPRQLHATAMSTPANRTLPGAYASRRAPPSTAAALHFGARSHAVTLPASGALSWGHAGGSKREATPVTAPCGREKRLRTPSCRLADSPRSAAAASAAQPLRQHTAVRRSAQSPAAPHGARASAAAHSPTLIPPVPASATAATAAAAAAAAPAVAASEEADAHLAAGGSAQLGQEEPEEEAAAAGSEQLPQEAAPRGRNLGGRPPANEQGKGRPSYDVMLQLQLEARQRRGGAANMQWKVGSRPLPAGKYGQL